MSNDPRNYLFHLLRMLESLMKIQKYTRVIYSTEELLEKEDQMINSRSMILCKRWTYLKSQGGRL